jgi:thiosulfate dehydrogenase
MPGRVAAVALAAAIALAPGARAAAPFHPPAEATIPAGPDGDAIRLGRSLVDDTRAQLPKNVGNGLVCSNCHLGGGTVAFAGPYVGLWGVFPEYRSRSGAVESLQQRINDCFERSMNGTALPWASREMNALLMYMQWLSTGVPVGTEVEGRGMGPVDPALVPDGARGRLVYAQKCASCHGAEGAGTKAPSGKYFFPPVWGPESFNVGAGMARTFTAAAFIRRNMPLGEGGTLSAQEALDVAEFVTHQPRPAYSPAKLDWPGGGRPQDARE